MKEPHIVHRGGSHLRGGFNSGKIFRHERGQAFSQGVVNPTGSAGGNRKSGFYLWLCRNKGQCQSQKSNRGYGGKVTWRLRMHGFLLLTLAAVKYFLGRHGVNIFWWTNNVGRKGKMKLSLV